jgi:hypothetical protein
MNVALWISAGLTLRQVVRTSRQTRNAPGGGGSATSARTFVRTLGGLEILGAVGLILPALHNIAPVLVPFGFGSFTG